MSRKTPSRSSTEIREAVQVARTLFEKLGDGAPWLVRFRAEALKADGDEDGARFWTRAARALRLMAAGAARAAPAKDLRQPNRSRGMFGSVEAYLQRAVEIERRAARAPGPHRPELLEIAGEWRALARAAQALAQSRPRATKG